MRQIDHEIDFDADDEADYEYDSGAVEFSGGVARTYSSFDGDTVIITPRRITTGWGAIRQVVPEVQEAANYKHFFAVAFEETSLDLEELPWRVWGVSGWVSLTGELGTSLFAEGMTLAQILAVPYWPVTGSIRFAVGIRRVDGGGY